MNYKIISSELLAEMEQRYRTQFINSIHGFKPANLVGTQNSKGETNLAIFSSVLHLGANPALVGMIARPYSEKSRRHSLENIMETGCYTLNQVHEGMYRQAHHSSARYDASVSEFAATGLKEGYVDGFGAPYVEESKLKMGLELREILVKVKE
jgi:flavin reductase (DIM6/NTAB) family NADH-FMN oxidoreductase RutF